MTIAGFTPPSLSAFDPPVAGEGSLDPMGLGALSDRLADQLVPGLRARMRRVRFVTAMAVSSLVCDTLQEEPPGDGISSAAISFEWLYVEALTQRLSAVEMPSGLPGSQKARSVITRGQRLSAATYLKGPTVFGFHGVYKPFAVDAEVVTADLAPGVRAVELVRAWESENGFEGFADGLPGSQGHKLRRNLTRETHAAIRDGRCTTNPSGWLFGHLARTLHPDHAGPIERTVLRSLITDGRHELRDELADLLPQTGELDDDELVTLVRPRCSAQLASVLDAIAAYERLARLIDSAFRTLCSISYSMGAVPMLSKDAERHPVIVHAAEALAPSYETAAGHLAALDFDHRLEERLGDFAISRAPVELVALLLAHHEQTQARKQPSGKRPWFEPLRDGWVVRSPYGSAERFDPEGPFIHPVRIETLDRFLMESSA